MVKPFLSLLLLLFMTAPALAEGNRYYAPPSNFNASFQIMDGGFANIPGFFRSGTSGFVYDPAGKTISQIKLAISIASLTTPQTDVAQELLALLRAQTSPEIVFLAHAPTQLSDGKGEIKGHMTLNGKTQPVVMEAMVRDVGKSPKGAGFWSKDGEVAGLSLKTTIKRADFDLADPPEMPGRFGDTLSLSVEMQAIRQ